MSFLKPPSVQTPPPNMLCTGSATGNPRNKVALKPGRSLMDWIRLGQSGKDLTGIGGRKMEVTPTELAKHNTEQDAWIAVRGKVYNVTPYFEYHPGGIPELIRGIGKEATDLFDEVHKWVNIESMLAKCYIGKLVPDKPDRSPVSTPPQRTDSKLSVPDLGPKLSIADVPPPTESKETIQPVFSVPVTKPIPRYEWFEGESTVSIVIYTRWKHMQHEYVVIERSEERARKLTLSVDDQIYVIHLKLQGEVTGEYQVRVSRPSGKVEVTLHKADTSADRWGTLGEPLPGHNTLTDTSKVDVVYRDCKIESVSPVSHDTNLYCVALPEACRMCVPVGHHVFVRGNIEGLDLNRSYTVVNKSLLQSEQDSRQDQGTALYLMIKIYPDGALTPSIGKLKPGDSISLSNSDGKFDVSCLKDVTHLTMFAAGTGFTPMVRLIYHLLISDHNSNRKVCLVFFNKTEKDILWREQLQLLCYSFTNFEVHHVLSQADTEWTGPSGRIRAELMEEFTPKPAEGCKEFFCACGPTPFTEETVRFAKELGYTDNTIHAFLG